MYIFGVAHVIPFNLNRTFQNKSKFLYSSLPLNIFSLFPVISDVADIEYSVWEMRLIKLCLLSPWITQSVGLDMTHSSFSLSVCTYFMISTEVSASHTGHNSVCLARVLSLNIIWYWHWDIYCQASLISRRTQTLHSLQFTVYMFRTYLVLVRVVLVLMCGTDCPVLQSAVTASCLLLTTPLTTRHS